MPGWQGLHAAEPALEAKPGRQGWQPGERPVEKVPAGQVPHCVAPRVLENRPAGQGTHVCCAKSEVKVPGAQ